MVLSRYISCSDQILMTSIWYSSAWPLICCDLWLWHCFDWLGAAVSSLLVNMVYMEESRSLSMMYGISSHHLFYISFLWEILSLDVWNLVPSFFYISFFMGGTRPLPMMYGDPLHHFSIYHSLWGEPVPYPWCMETRSITFLYIILYGGNPSLAHGVWRPAPSPFLFFLSYTLLPLYVYVLYFQYVSKVPDYMCSTT